jgi:hypothetical protein
MLFGLGLRTTYRRLSKRRDRGEQNHVRVPFPGYLPSAEDLPDSDETPVDNELQELGGSLASG